MPFGSAKRITSIALVGSRDRRAMMNGLEVSTIGTRWKFTWVG